MEVAVVFGCALAIGGIYELMRPKRRAQQQNFIVFYDSYGVRHILNMDTNTSNINSEQEINSKTKSYISDTEMGICTISQEEIVPGDEIIELKCGHFFKKQFAIKWLEQNNECPLCREKFN